MKDRKSAIAMVSQVTIEHGLAFAQGWYDGEGDIIDACADTDIMTWPDGGLELKELHTHFNDLADEICANVFALTKWQIAEAFVRVANEVLTRERNRGHGEEISVVAVVTTEQGRTFADSWIERARQTEIPDEAFAAAGVMVWPDENPRAQARFHAIMDDMLDRFWMEIREPMASVFVDAANHVINSRK